MNKIENETQLEKLLSTPGAGDCEFMSRLDGDVMVLGAGGKMGPSLAARVKRATDQAGRSRRVFAVSRFSSRQAAESLAAAGIEIIEADLLDRSAYGRLPEAPNILYLAGRKFGSTDRPDLTWAMNTLVPAYTCERFRSSRIVAFSSGNVYPFVTAASGGCVETDPVAPVGEYAQSCVARERVIEYFSRENGTPVLLFRLNYAVDLRYGVLVDIARKVHDGEPVELGVGSFNVIWQGDANSYALRCLELCASPPRILNVTGPETVSLRRAARFFRACFGTEPKFVGEESPTALLSNASACHSILGYPEISVGTLMEWVADWVGRGQPLLNKPTHFEVTDGKF